jgi:WD40 repeat protein
MVSPRIVFALVLLAGCHGPSLPPPVPDAAPLSPDAGPDGPRFPASTTWGECQTIGKVDYTTSLAVSPDGHYLAAGSSTTWIWDLRSGAFVRMIHSDGGLQYGFSRDGALLAMTGDGRYVFRVADGGELFTVGSRAPNCVDWSSAGAISPDKRTLALGSCGFLELHAIDGSGVQRLPSRVFAPGVAYSADGHFLATSGPELYRGDGGERLWPADVPPVPDPGNLTFLEYSLRDNTVSFSPDGALLLVSNTIDKPNGGMKAWTASTQLLRVSDGALVHDFGGALPRGPSFSPDGAWIVAGGQLVHLATLAFSTLPLDQEVSAFLPDGRIAALGQDSVVRLYCPH